MSPEELQTRVERFQEACRHSGVKLTHQRLEIFREVASSTAHPDAEAVYKAVRQRLPTVSLDTVYRTLWTLTDVGLLSTLGPRRERARFDANLAPHHHFVCVRCGTAEDFESKDLDAVCVPPGVERFGKVLGTHVEVRGVCSECGAKGAPGVPALRGGGGS
ncbi:MAG TPA: Fur family transcriptional regulator [Myxococcales bacterium]|jgi:Fur family peroxide stress response transcriptional regulator